MASVKAAAVVAVGVGDIDNVRRRYQQEEAAACTTASPLTSTFRETTRTPSYPSSRYDDVTRHLFLSALQCDVRTLWCFIHTANDDAIIVVALMLAVASTTAV